MKKVLVAGIVAVMLMGSMPQAEAQQRSGGIGGFLVGCCFGIRTAGQFNAGKDLHFRDWGRLIPIVNIGLAVWDGIQGFEGVTTADLSRNYGSQFY